MWGGVTWVRGIIGSMGSCARPGPCPARRLDAFLVLEEDFLPCLLLADF